MIFFRKFPNHGRFGNQLFQLASLLGFAKKYNCEFKVAKWPYSEYFKNPIPSGIIEHPEIDLQEPQFHYTPEWWDVHTEDFKNKTVNITGWLQSEKYFEHCANEVREMFEIKQELLDEVKTKYTEAFTKPVIAISIRRGDYVNNPNYTLLPIKYYLLGLLEQFPDFRENYNIIIFTDDFAYAKIHFQCLKNVWYADELNDIRQMALGTLCDHFIIANSTFSWWMAWLGEKSHTKVIRPNFLFAGELKKKSQEWSFFPDRWIVVDHKIKNIDLKDVTFTIPVKYDSKDRMDNANLSIKMLRHDFDTNIIVGEQHFQRFSYLGDICRYMHFTDMPVFHRTKMLNDMAADCKTPIIANWDCDVVIPPLQLIETVHLLRTKKADMVYPYDGRFARVNRNKWYRIVDDKADVGMFGNAQFNGMHPQDAKSVGGAVFFDTQAFITGGMENEHFISYGPEDAERYDRFNALRYRIERVDGVLYHFDHVIGQDSSVSHPYFNANKAELLKIRSMDYHALKAYVMEWSWAKRYTPLYYESILGESVKSRDAVFAVLEEHGTLNDSSKIIDVGCALGAWGFQSKYNYTGIDYQVPLNKLVVSVLRYLDHDLRKPFPEKIGPFDICLCLEVAEHLEPEFADQLVESLCSLSDTVLFSAAIPGQGGINHLNEQWQSWWAEKFAKHEYFPQLGDIRNKIWDNPDVGVWYRQNMVVYVKMGYEEKNLMPILDGYPYPLDKVHPQMYMNLMKHYKILN